MSRSFTAVPVVLLAFTLTGCTTGDAVTTSTTSTPRPSAVAVADQGSGGYDLGNDRPHVTNDGLMVRRRVVIAIQPTPGAHLDSLRKELDTAATRGHTSLTSIPRGVLDPALMEPVAPEMALALPPGKTLADARRLVDLATLKGRRDVERYDVAAVLVHDLRFTVSSAKPAVLAEAIAREGILSDALGNYTTTLGRQRLDITYTGPLLSDDLVEAVRGGIARRANVRPVAVIVSPRTTTGVGVDMAKEPAPAPAVVVASKAHGRHSAPLPAVSAAPPAVAASPPWGVWAVSVAALAALFLTLVLLIRRRVNRARPRLQDFPGSKTKE